MKEPLYRWVCTVCGISDEAENSTMARLNVDAHMQVVHPSAREAVGVRPDPTRDLLAQDQGQQGEEPGRRPADEDDDRSGPS